MSTPKPQRAPLRLSSVALLPCLLLLVALATACNSPLTLTSSANINSRAETANLASSANIATTLSTTTAPITLTFWDENAGPSRTPYYMELLHRFEGQHPDIHVEYVGVPISFNKQNYDIAISANAMPDIAVVNAGWIADFAEKGVLLPLDERLPSWSEREQIPSELLDYNRSLVPDRKLYQIPGTFYFDALWYRADWFLEAGLSPPQTWDDVLGAAQLLNKPQEGRYGYSLRGASGSITQLTALMYAYSGITSYFREDGSCTVNDPLHLQFLQQYTSLYGNATKKSDILNGYKEIVAAFDNGEAAMINHNFGSYRDHLLALGEEQVGGALLPRSINGTRVMITAANGYSIFKSSAHPDAAWNLMQFLLSEESQTYWNEHAGQLPTNKNSLQQPFVAHNPFAQEALAAIKDEQTVLLQMPYHLPSYPNIIKQQVEPNWQKVLAGKMSEEEFLNDWATVMESAYAAATAAANTR